MNTTAPRHARTTRATILLLAATAVLTGCTSDSLPPADRPEVVWKDGKPEGPLENDPRVLAVRGHDLELSIAQATRDFTSTGWHDVAVSTEIGRRALYFTESVEKGDLKFPPGPTPMIPMYIDERSDGTSHVLVCEASPWSWTGERRETHFPLHGWLSWYIVVKEDGKFKVSDIAGGQVEGSKIIAGEKVIEPFLDDREDSDCNLDDAKVGLFDPPPDPALEYGPEDLKLSGSPE